MAILKKIQASTLMETMVATVLIVIVFMMCSLILNSLFNTSVKNNTMALQERFSELEYRIKKGKLTIPYSEKLNDWEIHVVEGSLKGGGQVVITALQQKTKKEITSYFIYE